MNENALSALWLPVVLLVLQGILSATRAVLIQSRWESEEEDQPLKPSLHPDITRLSVGLDFAILLTGGTYFITGLNVLSPILHDMEATLLSTEPGWLSTLTDILLVIVLGWVNLSVGTLAPEALGHTFSTQWHEWVTSLSQILHCLLRPFSMSALALGNLLAKGVKGQPLQRLATITEEEIKSAVSAGEQEGIIEEEAREMIYSIFNLDNMITREIMIPRIDIIALEVNTPLDNTLDTIIASGHSRFPVYEETIDNIIGILHAKDLLLQYQNKCDGMPLRAEILRPAYFVPESKRLDNLLKEMQHDKIQLAIVVDEYGGTAGLVTLEDIVEEIVGEIHDEYDQEEPEVVFENDGSYLFEARIPLDDVQNMLDIPLPLEEADSLSGFIYNQLGHVPTVGERLIFGDAAFEVTEITGRRIRKVRATRIAANAG